LFFEAGWDRTFLGALSRFFYGCFHSNRFTRVIS
jgi:hypothetical protein